MKYLVICSSYGDKNVVEAVETLEAAIEAIRKDMDNDNIDNGDLSDNLYYEVHEVKATFRYIPPADKGQLVKA